MATKTKVFAQQLRSMPEFVAVFRAMTNLRVLVFYLVAWVMGIGMGLIFTFLFWHLQDVNPDSPQGDLYRLSSKFFKSFPVLNPPEYGREFIDAMAEVLEQSDHFGPTTITEYPWQQAYEGGMFKVLFRSASNYARLDAGAQGEIEAELENHIAGLSGDPVINYRTCLIMARSNGPQG